MDLDGEAVPAEAAVDGPEGVQYRGILQRLIFRRRLAMAQRGTTWKTTASMVRALALATLLVGVGACSDDDSPTSQTVPNP